MTASQRIRRAALPTFMAAVSGAGGAAAGVAIVAVTKGGPADRAGLRAGDVISSVAGTATPDTTTLAQVLASQEPGQVVSVTVDRDGAGHSVRLTLGELPGG